jgi:hypothetical protein
VQPGCRHPGHRGARCGEGFCAKEILADPTLAVTRFGCPGASAFRLARASGLGGTLRLRLRSRLGLASTVELLRLRRGRKPGPVLRARRVRSYGRRLAAGRYRVRVLGRAESGIVDRREATVTVRGGRVTVLRGGLKRRGACRR